MHHPAVKRYLLTFNFHVSVISLLVNIEKSVAGVLHKMINILKTPFPL
jgi:hypothetical protein